MTTAPSQDSPVGPVADQTATPVEAAGETPVLVTAAPAQPAASARRLSA
jgi:hypothetical protein